jgi:hypothetical protein
MATSTVEIVPMLDREINTAGVEMLPDVTNTQLSLYVEDGFWDVKLGGMLTGYTVVDGPDVVAATPPTSGRWITDASTKAEDLPQEYWMLVTIFAGARLIRNKIMNLALSFSAKAGPAEYEQQASATVLRAILDQLNKRAQELKTQYSDDFGGAGMSYMDGVLQAGYSQLAGLPSLTVIP